MKARRLVISFNSRPRVIKKKKKSQAAVHPCVCLKSDLLPASSHALSHSPRYALCPSQPVAFRQGWHLYSIVNAFTFHTLSRGLSLLCSARAHQPSASDPLSRNQAAGRVDIMILGARTTGHLLGTPLSAKLRTGQQSGGRLFRVVSEQSRHCTSSGSIPQNQAEREHY